MLSDGRTLCIARLLWQQGWRIVYLLMQAVHIVPHTELRYPAINMPPATSGLPTNQPLTGPASRTRRRRR